MLKKLRDISLPIKLLFLTIISANTAVSQETDEFHKPFDIVLRENVFDGEVNYKGIKENTNFAKYIESLEAKPKFSNKYEFQ